jgi:hypothetical protein
MLRQLPFLGVDIEVLVVAVPEEVFGMFVAAGG